MLSDSGVPIEDISRLVGHSNTVVTETVYRHQIRPVIMQGSCSDGQDLRELVTQTPFSRSEIQCFRRWAVLGSNQ
ncbi:hypothetical protein ACWEPN_31525 [Nonomuraea wenchangensis]